MVYKTEIIQIIILQEETQDLFSKTCSLTNSAIFLLETKTLKVTHIEGHNTKKEQ